MASSGCARGPPRRRAAAAVPPKHEEAPSLDLAAVAAARCNCLACPHLLFLDATSNPCELRPSSISGLVAAWNACIETFGSVVLTLLAPARLHRKRHSAVCCCKGERWRGVDGSGGESAPGTGVRRPLGAAGVRPQAELPPLPAVSPAGLARRAAQLPGNWPGASGVTRGFYGN